MGLAKMGIISIFVWYDIRKNGTRFSPSLHQCQIEIR